jgi:hypothetical protein
LKELDFQEGIGGNLMKKIKFGNDDEKEGE